MELFEELNSLLGTYGIESISISASTSAPEHNDMDDTHREDNGWDAGERTDEDGELLRDRRFLSGSMCNDNDESIQEADKDIGTDDCMCETSCTSLFNLDRIQDHILSVRELEKSEKELYVIGSLHKFAHGKTKGGNRKRKRYRYVYDVRNVTLREREVYRETLREAADEMSSHGFGESRCVIHADNCGGQNNNRYVLAYLSWRIQMGLHEEILLLMQIPGHTRCLVDSGFANIKKLFRQCDVESLAQLAEVVDKSSKSN
ncbi:hypothetical protein MAR_026884 [Mya arenaria]|uniref:DUF7869 domain-containing protein n=1 Tax=Mya arenaria TaxID=6604 RepID=A0ABY7EUC2_MYAAR|nr:hypothetical protein MAR_026884 [Mya arenaria]